MTTSAALISFTFAAALLAITPGLDTALVLRTAALEGRRSAYAAALGISLGVMVWGSIVALGPGALLAASQRADRSVPLFTVGPATIHALEGILWFALLIAATAPVVGMLRRPAIMKTLDRITGAILIAFGIRLVAESRR